MNLAYNDLELGDDEGGSSSSGSDSMSETTVTEQGALSQMGGSFKNMLVGLVCFALSWPVLYCGASRTHWNKIFKNAVPVEQAKGDDLAYVTGTPVADAIGDGANLEKGKYLSISKSTEVMAWVENVKSDSKTDKSLTGTKTTTETKTYSYAIEWTSSPKDVSSFNQEKWKTWKTKNNIPADVQNPKIADSEKSTSIYAPGCKVNDYDIDVKSTQFYSGSKQLPKVYLVGKEGTNKLGDKRVSYSVQPSDISYTFAGALSGKKIVPYVKDTESKMVANPGEFKQLLAQIKGEDQMMGYIWFGAGFILMAAGLMMLVGPITTLLEFIPFIGGLGSGLIKVVLAIVAFVLSAIFWWVVKLWWLILLVVLGFVAFGIYKKKTAAAPKPA